ncbi:MAG: N,N-dimethylformamidase beta subunit family domain-containing protein [Phyllobacterium sp.]
MKRAVDHAAMAVAGYTTPWHPHAGRRISLHLSSAKAVERPVIRRLDTPEAELVGWAVEATSHAPDIRSFEQGSYVEIKASELARAGCLQGIRFELFLTRNPGRRTLLHTKAFRLVLEAGNIALESSGETRIVATSVPSHEWLHLSIQRENSVLRIKTTSNDALAPYENDFIAEMDVRNWGQGGLYLATAPDFLEPTLNARLARIALLGDDDWIEWQFPTLFTDMPLKADNAETELQLRGNPTFCVASSRWDGSSYEPRLVPTHYDAVHFHDDDMAGLDWPASFFTDIPDGAPSGVYAFEVASGESIEKIVFFITAKEPRAPLLFVLPTATYLAYSDEELPPAHYEWKCKDRGHRFARDNGLKSLYDFHSDLSGVSLLSCRKPKATLRDDYLYPLCGCPHLLPVDLHFLKFCRSNGVAIDVVTDRDLHERGSALLDNYRAVVTGSHPEYMSVEMEAAYRTYLGTGGSLAYLGGNGFAGTVAFRDDLMELRRSPLEPNRTWDGPVHEQGFALTNEPGGHLRTRGKGEYSLVGVGMSLMGFDQALPYTRTAESHDAACQWLFAGIENETFGDYGLVLGGVAGYEVDATNAYMGSARDIVVLARADGFSEAYVDDPARWHEGSIAERQKRRCAEMTIRHLKSGGLIFTASSVSWCGALPNGGEMNDVGKITLNLLMHLATDEKTHGNSPSPV